MRGKWSVAIKRTTSPSFPEGPWLGTRFPSPVPMRPDSCILNKIPFPPLVSLQHPLLPHPLLVFLIFKGVLWSCRQRSLTKTKVSLAVESGKNKPGSSIQYYTCFFVCLFVFDMLCSMILRGITTHSHKKLWNTHHTYSPHPSSARSPLLPCMCTHVYT